MDVAWRKEVRILIRDVFHSELEHSRKIKRPKENLVIATDGDDFDKFFLACIQTSTSSDEKSFIFYVNYGVGRYSFLNERGFGPKRPSNDADCIQSQRLEAEDFDPSSKSRAFKIDTTRWCDQSYKDYVQGYFSHVAKSVVLPRLCEWAEKL